MLFFFGVNKSKLKNHFLLNNCICPHCNNANTLTTQTHAKYFHFFFFPIFPLSKTTTATCSHCKLHLQEDNFTEEMKRVYQNQETLNPNTRPIWHGCGCFIILSFIVLSLISGIFAYFTYDKGKNNSSEKVDSFSFNYLNDLDNLTINPKLKNDTISLEAKDCLDEFLAGIVNTDRIEYYSKQKGDNILLIVKISDIKKIKSNTRKEILNYLYDWFSMDENFKNKKFYIAIEGQWNTVLISTPKGVDDDGKYANTDLLDNFYKENTPVKDTLNITIKNKKNEDRDF